MGSRPLAVPFLVAMLATLVPLESRAGVSPSFAVRPNTVSVSGGQALLTVRSLGTDVLTNGFQFRFTFDGPLGTVTATTGPPIVHSATLVPSDFAVAGVGTNLIVVNYLAGPKVWAAGETIALRATFTLTPATERSVEVLFHSSNGPEGPGDTLAFVTFPVLPRGAAGLLRRVIASLGRLGPGPL